MGETFPDVLSPRERWRVWFVNMGGQGKGEKELSKRILPSWRFFNSFDSAPRKDIPRIFLSFLSRLQHFEDTFENWTRGNSFFRDKIRKHRYLRKKCKEEIPFSEEKFEKPKIPMKFDIFANNLGRGGESQRGKFTIEIVRGYLGYLESLIFGY